MKNILVLGAGMVAKPLVRYLLDQENINVILADQMQEKAQALIAQHPRGSARALNVKDDDRLSELVANADLVVSLLPYAFHVRVAQYCLAHNTHLITASYVSTDMKALDQSARDRGLLFLNEMGLDPGIDHMSAMKIIHEVEGRGGKIVSLESCCGGLPAPEANDNPFGYKFSWSPRGVVMAGLGPARYLKDGKEIRIPGRELFKHHWLKPVQGLGELEVYPNRDSLMYKELYGLKDVHTLFRGTFRNPGWCETLEKIVQLGYLDETENPDLPNKTFAQVTAELINASPNADLKKSLALFLNLPEDSPIIARLEWLGLLSNDKINAEPPTLLDALATRMQEKMSYKEGERDMIVLQHDFVAEYADGKKEQICSLLIDYGIPHGDSSMARTVSLPVAIASRLIVNGQITLTGVHVPVQPEIYQPVLQELEDMGIKFKESITRIA